MKIKEAVEICKKSELTEWKLVEYAQSIVHNNMAYSYNNSFDMPFKAFEKGKGYCWQQAKTLQKILRSLGFTCYLVYAVKNRIPETKFEGIKIDEHISGHVWCRVKINNLVKDVCPGNKNNRPGVIHFTPLSIIKKYKWYISFGCYFGSAYVNRKRYIKIKKKK
jgi:hypothetical protein